MSKKRINVFPIDQIGNVINNVNKLNICPCCNKKLVKKYEGLVCTNFNCVLYFKLGRGWVYLNKAKENSELFFTSKYDFDPESYLNRKKWLKLKSKILYEKKSCEICGEKRLLHVHHILPKSQNPELAMDEENLMVLCEDCHKKIHSKDKWRFS